MAGPASVSIVSAAARSRGSYSSSSHGRGPGSRNTAGDNIWQTLLRMEEAAMDREEQLQQQEQQQQPIAPELAGLRPLRVRTTADAGSISFAHAPTTATETTPQQQLSQLALSLHRELSVDCDSLSVVQSQHSWGTAVGGATPRCITDTSGASLQPLDVNSITLSFTGRSEAAAAFRSGTWDWDGAVAGSMGSTMVFRPASVPGASHINPHDSPGTASAGIPGRQAPALQQGFVAPHQGRSPNTSTPGSQSQTRQTPTPPAQWQGTELALEVGPSFPSLQAPQQQRQPTSNNGSGWRRITGHGMRLKCRGKNREIKQGDGQSILPTTCTLWRW
jgi:hypothetical protein